MHLLSTANVNPLGSVQDIGIGRYRYSNASIIRIDSCIDYIFQLFIKLFSPTASTTASTFASSAASSCTFLTGDPFANLIKIRSRHASPGFCHLGVLGASRVTPRVIDLLLISLLIVCLGSCLGFTRFSLLPADDAKKDGRNWSAQLAAQLSAPIPYIPSLSDMITDVLPRYALSHSSTSPPPCHHSSLAQNPKPTLV